MPDIMEKDPLLVTYHVAEPSDVVETNQKTSNRLTIVGRVAGVVRIMWIPAMLLPSTLIILHRRLLMSLSLHGSPSRRTGSAAD